MRAIFCLTAIFALTFYMGTALAEGQFISASDTYPHITALENAILGESFPAQSLTERLERMEKKAFGSASTNPDLSERTDALDDYTDKQLHKKLLQANVDSETADSTENQPSQNQADYPHVTALEQAILGQTFAEQPLADRLGRMEIKAFGSVSTNLALSDRTDALETYAEKKLHKQPLAQGEDDNTAGTSNAPGAGGLLSRVGQTIFGMATGMGGPGIGGIGNGGMGFNGGGMGYGGMGMGRGTGRRQAQQQQQPEPPAPVHQEDPSVYLVAPPDPSARLIVKVGWCEVKIFGHTFPNMHLTERLGQLNRELNLEPGKSEVQLMDDIGLMVKAVQARKQTVPIRQP